MVLWCCGDMNGRCVFVIFQLCAKSVFAAVTIVNHTVNHTVNHNAIAKPIPKPKYTGAFRFPTSCDVGATADNAQDTLFLQLSADHHCRALKPF